MNPIGFSMRKSARLDVIIISIKKKKKQKRRDTNDCKVNIDYQ